MVDIPTIGESVVSELGLAGAWDGDVVRGHGEVVPELCVPGTDVLRTSVVVTWADVVTGYVSSRSITPRIPLTLDLEVQVAAPARLGDQMMIEASCLKAGRTVTVADATLRNVDTGALIAYSVATFFASPNPDHEFPGGFPDLSDMPVGRLPEPFADRAGITIVERGVAEVPHRGRNLNASGAVQGGLVSLCAEQAVASLHEGPVVLDAINLRYLKGITGGPGRAVAEPVGESSAVVRITDVARDKLATLITAHTRAI